MMRRKKQFVEVLFFIAAISYIFIFSGYRYLNSSDRAQTPYPKDSVILSFPIDTTPVILPLDTVQCRLSFVIDSICGIADPTSSMEHFYHQLEMLQDGKDTVITIVHIGDSHIQAGYFSGQFMRLMHGQYGNAGRGWIAPFKLSKTNEPDDYFISSVVKDWTAGRCIQNTLKCPLGPGAIGLQSVSPFINLDVVIASNNGAGYEFNQAVLYRGDKSMPMLPSGTIKDFVEVSTGSYDEVPGIVTDTFQISCLTDTLQLQSTRRKQGTDSLIPASHFTNLYYGFTLTNGGPGILYHSIGVNGAMFVNYTDSNYVRQLALFKPSLLIISLGTNETFGRRFTKAEFAGQVETFIHLIKEYLPETSILLTTPPECYKRVTVNKQRTYVRNENTERAAQVLVEVAREQGIACWDMFASTGGKDSHKNWHNGKWMGRDRIHFNKDGYREQGILLFRAIHKRIDN